MIIVFDFDKTLTYEDTLFGFFYICSRNDLTTCIKLPLYFLSMVAHKLKLISNENFKRIGVRLFLRGKTKEFIRNCAEEYSGNIKLNHVYHTEFKKYNNPYVISASFYEYLLPLFPTANILCSEIEFSDNRVKCLKTNCYGKVKYQLLSANGIDYIDILYTDSVSDLPLARFSKEINLVKGDQIIKCHDLEHFLELVI